jgi:protein TonB
VAASGAQIAGDAVYEPGKGVSSPVAVKEVRPRYPAAAQNAKIQGLVRLECVVLPDGTVGEVRVIEPLDPALDEEAIKAVKQWRFKPGTKGGQAVPVRVPIDMTFTLR